MGPITLQLHHSEAQHVPMPVPPGALGEVLRSPAWALRRGTLSPPQPYQEMAAVGSVRQPDRLTAPAPAPTCDQVTRLLF